MLRNVNLFSIMKTLRLYVTKKDINEGERYDCNACPIARAARRALRRAGVSFDNVQVTHSRVWVHLDGCCVALGKLTPKMRVFVSEFDCLMHVAPQRFTVELEKW